MSTWRYIKDGQELGPADTPAMLALLQSGTLSGDALVRKQGLANWVPARTFPELANPIAPTDLSPPPIASAGTAPPNPSPPLLGALGAPAPDAADIEQNKGYAVLAYLGILFLVPLLAAPNSRFARYHTNQGIVLFLATLVITAGSIPLFLLSVFPILGCFTAVAPFAAMAGVIVLMILGIINAASGKCEPLPLIGGIQILK
jgi:uncharacterized membrane protein